LQKHKGTRKSGPEFKITIVGNGSVGKTSLIHRFCDESFQKTYLATVGVDITTKALDLSPKVTFTFVFWDIAGQERFKSHRSVFYKGTQGVIMVCDSTNLQSVESLPEWHEEVVKSCGPELPTALLVNKIDLQDKRTVDDNQIKRIQTILKLPEKMTFETSALKGDNVDKAFFTLGETLANKYM
jgi:small GTP-binding protein